MYSYHVSDCNTVSLRNPGNPLKIMIRHIKTVCVNLTNHYTNICIDTQSSLQSHYIILLF